MEQKNVYVMFDLIRSAVYDTLLSDSKNTVLSEEDVKEILTESKRHDVLHLVGYGLYKNGMITKESKYYETVQKIQAMAIYRYERLNHVLEKLCQIFEAEGIAFMPLKGSVIRKRYREGWLRTSCDIDILVKNEDVESAVSVLTDKYGYTLRGKTSCDYSLFSPENVHLELHYTLVGNYVSERSYEILKKTWESAIKKEGQNYWYEMPDEMFYYYHIVHMAKHFISGGCGIKPFIDMLILEEDGAHKDERDVLLDKGGLLKFAESVRKLYRVWFFGDKPNGTTAQMQEYLFYGGVYGTSENKVTLMQQRKGGKIRYALSRVFMPYDELRFRYPALENKKYLMPYFTVRRWLEVFSKDRFDRISHEVEMNNTVSDKKAKDTKKLLNDLGL